MADEKKNPEVPTEGPAPEPAAPEESDTAQSGAQNEADGLIRSELDAAKKELTAAEDKYLRLAAEYDNFRKRTAKEKESIWSEAKADTVSAFLSVYDNLERAVKQPCSDEAYAKGVEMTLNGLKDVMTKLGIEEIPALGEVFDANLHNAVMHVEDETAEENTIVEVFQNGFRLGDKIIRFAMVKVAN